MIGRFWSSLLSGNTPPILYYSKYSPQARAVYMICKYLNVNIELKELDILSSDYRIPELLKINPQHCIPTLNDNDFVIWDSHAIAGYLVGKYAKDDQLYPKNPKLRAIVDQRLHFDTEVLYPRIYEATYPILFRGKTSVTNETLKGVLRAYEISEHLLGDNIWIAGNNTTIADFCCSSSISTLEYIVPILETQHPKLRTYMSACQTLLPYYKEINATGVEELGRMLQKCLIDSYVKRFNIFKPA